MIPKDVTLMVNVNHKTETSFVIEYSVTNNSDKTVFLLNSGDSMSPAKAQAIYIKPQPDGTIEISRGGLPNAAKPNRSPTFPIEYGATELVPRKTFKETVVVSLPLQPYSPFRSFTNNPLPMPPVVQQARFCVGVIRDDKIKTKESNFTVLENYTDVAKQETICSNNFQIK